MQINLNITCSEGLLKQPFPNFLFSRTVIFYLFFFPEIKNLLKKEIKKQKIFSFLLPLINSDIILQESKEMLL